MKQAIPHCSFKLKSALGAVKLYDRRKTLARRSLEIALESGCPAVVAPTL